jgi:beta-glucosidase
MDSYNLTNGAHMTQNKTLNLDVAKDQWHFPGVIMFDWVATYDTAAAANGGLDLEMPFGVYYAPEKILPLIKNGTMSQATIDDKVRRILRVAADFGWLDRPQMDIDIPRYNLEGRAVSLEAAIEGAVLLKNENNALPLDRKVIKTIAVIGPTAAQTVTTGGGSGEVVSFASTNLLVGVSNYLGEQTKVLYARRLYSIFQMARLTHFTTDPEGVTAGVTHATYAKPTSKAASPAPSPNPTLALQVLHAASPRSKSSTPSLHTRTPTPYVRATNSSKWTGYYTPAEAGKSAIFIQTDGRYRLLVDDKVVFDNSVVPKYILNQAILDLTKTPHKVVVEQLSQQIGSVSGMRVGIAPLNTIVEKTLSKWPPRPTPSSSPSASTPHPSLKAATAASSFQSDRSSLFSRSPPSAKRPSSSSPPVEVSTSLSGKTKSRVSSRPGTPANRAEPAAARLLVGDENPSCHLPISWEQKLTDNPSFAHYYPDPGTNKIVYREGIFMGYRGYEHNHVEPQYPFGFGLSYTTFSFSKLKAAPAGDDRFTVTFDVTNTGKRSGATVAQLYVGESSPQVERLMLQPGETKHITLELDPRSFSYFDVKASTWQADAGTYTLELGDSSKNIQQKTTIQLPKPLMTPVSD